MGRSAPVIIDPTNRQTLYVGSEGGGVFKSLDGGDHWFAVNSGLDELTVDGLAMDPGNPAVLYACGPKRRLQNAHGSRSAERFDTISAVLNGASYLTGPVSPDEIVVITGSGLGPGQLIAATPGANGLYSSTQLSGTTVQFNGTPGAVDLHLGESGRGASSDWFLVGAAQVTVTYEGRTSGPFPLQVTQNSPGVFTLDSSGKGQAVAMNQDGSINTPAKPAEAGDVISLYGTGVTSGQGGVFVIVGGQTATWRYTSLGGVMRFDVRIPSGILTSRAVPVVVLINQDAVVESQSGVTVAVQDASQAARLLQGPTIDAQRPLKSRRRDMKTRFLLPVFLSGAIGHPGIVMAQSTATSTPGAAQIHATAGYARLPMSFEPCFEAICGESGSQAKYFSHGSGYLLFLTPTEAVLDAGPSKESTLRMKLLRSNSRASMQGMDPLPGKSNYFIGKNPKSWRSNVTNYAK